ncbi:MAG: hypothetical protein NUW00_02015 [Candidatus Kaiserbacteria bacterium]|nr:hypothetical protein [Candidatus Kaiserbacteria bacterium]
MQLKNTKVVTGEQARKYILEGVNAIYEPVKRTLGPKGTNALLYGTYGQSPRITNDGVTIAECIEPKNEFVNLVATAFKEACKKTNEKAGDATTTTSVIAGKAVNDILSGNNTSVFSDVSTDMMKKREEILKLIPVIVEKIKEKAIKIDSLEDLEKIAIISVQDEAIGKLIAGIVYQVGIDGFVDVQEGFKGKIEHEVIEGMRFPAKVPAKIFVNNEARYEMILEDTPVLVTNYTMDNVGEVGMMLKNVLGTTLRKITILAPSFSDQVLVEFVKAKAGNLIISPVKVPSLRSVQFEDACAYFDATFINKDEGRTLISVTQQDLGFVDRLIVKDVEAREDAIAIGGRGSKSDTVKARIEELKKSIEETKVPTHKLIIERRIASLASSVAVIRVGAPTDAETRYLKLKVDDAVYACKGALEEGCVKGAGICLNDIADEIGDSVITSALKAPYEYIKSTRETGEEAGDDVIDNAKAVRCAVEHALSLTAHLITVDILVPEARDASPAEGYSDIAQAILITHKRDANGNTESDTEGQYDRMLEEHLIGNR